MRSDFIHTQNDSSSDPTQNVQLTVLPYDARNSTISKFAALDLPVDTTTTTARRTSQHG
jgi:hypothetical protein